MLEKYTRISIKQFEALTDCTYAVQLTAGLLSWQGGSGTCPGPHSTNAAWDH
jgi:hypothetical protein